MVLLDSTSPSSTDALQQLTPFARSSRRSGTPLPRLIRRSFHGRAGVHDDIKTSCLGALGSGLVDHAKLKPHGLDAQPLLLGNGLVDHRADPLTVHKAIHDLHRGRDISKPVISPLAQGILTAKVDWDDAHPELVAQILSDAVRGARGV